MSCTPPHRPDLVSQAERVLRDNRRFRHEPTRDHLATLVAELDRFIQLLRASTEPPEGDDPVSTAKPGNRQP